jgi:hypothetical protein
MNGFVALDDTVQVLCFQFCSAYCFQYFSVSETASHLFVQCPSVQQIWHPFVDQLRYSLPNQLSLTDFFRAWWNRSDTNPSRSGQTSVCYLWEVFKFVTAVDLTEAQLLE